MIKQQRDYIMVRKKKFLIGALIWTALMLIVFFIGLITLKSRESYFTLIAALLVLPLTQNTVRFISFNRFKDPKPEFAEVLDKMKGNYHLFHSVIMPDTIATVFFEHLVVTPQNIYFLTEQKKSIEAHRNWIENRLVAKGILAHDVHFIHIKHMASLKNIVLEIEDKACYTSEGLEQNTKIIENMLM